MADNLETTITPRQYAEAHMSKALEDIAAERQRQIDAEGWTPEHDDKHGGGELAIAAATYALHSAGRRMHRPGSCPVNWPWDISWWKPTTPYRDLVKAAALIVAELERRNRAAGQRP